MDNLIRTYTMDKTALSIAALTDKSDETAFWQSKTPAERLQALEFMRQVMYGGARRALLHPLLNFTRQYSILRIAPDS
jgi:hypothetical protein